MIYSPKGLYAKEVKIILTSTEKDDLKSKKTKNALNTSLLSLLGKYSFEKISVRNICEEALISRAAFYAHFTDKYDFLQYWLMNLVKKCPNQDQMDIHTSEVINKVVNEHKKTIRNLVLDARKETMDVLFDVILTTLNFDMTNEKIDAKSIVISNFYAGGILFYLLWQVEHRFPQDITPVNEYLCTIMKYFQTFLDGGL